MIKIAAAFLSLYSILTFTLYADTPHKVSSMQSEGLILHYALKDLGEIDLTSENLTRQQEGLSFGPMINNHGDIIGNRSTGGFLIFNKGGEYTPFIQDARFNFYALNNKNDVLMSISRGDAVEWFVWPAASRESGGRLLVDSVELEGNKISLSGINDQQKVIGVAKPDNRSMPLEWESEKGLYRIGTAQSENLFGTVNDINARNTIVGKSHRQLENFPFAIVDGQLLNLFKFRSQFKLPSDGKIIFDDLVLSGDDTIYGTYWIDTNFDDPKAKKNQAYQAFKWNPVENSLTLLDIDGMRISAVNDQHILVGAHKGKASFQEGNYKPHNLISVIDNKETQGWDLLEATSINDEGQIVGYGKKEGKMHLFLASPRKDPNLAEVKNAAF